MFHYVSGIPVEMLCGLSCVYRLPQEIPSAAQITGDRSLLPAPGPDDRSVQYLTTPALETYLLLSTGDGFLLRAGPVLQSPVNPERLAPLIRAGVLPFRCKQALGAHYSSCRVLDDRTLFYAGKMLETLLLREAPAPNLVEVVPDTGAPIDNSFFSQTFDYRSMQFQHAPYAIEQEVCRMIANGDTASSKHILRDINRMPRAKLANTPFRSLKNSLICSCTFMARAAITGGVKPDEAFTLSDAYIQRIEASATTLDLYGFEAEMIEGFTAHVRAVQGERFSAKVAQAMQYINLHLSDPLTVATIAGAVFHNANYLSRLFKHETGETIHQYILKKRIEEAAHFVKNTNDSIADIASFYQFCSQSHFVQCFRKAMGVTPGEYRRRTFAAGS
ncbi:MAG: AraC family transcriptional regulator [Clostridiales bacterium]|nr:AraC family transcriptional regulator [Clostridiales bacterium]